MSENLGEGTTTGEQPTTEKQSPSEKLEGKPSVGSDVPGAENPESREVKEEVNPNTE